MMYYIEMFFLAVGLSMDSLAVSVAGGAVARQRCGAGVIVRVATVLALFQSAMTLLGFFAGKGFAGVEDVKIDAELLRHTARVFSSLAVAAAFRHETHVDADHFVASCLQKMDGDGAVNTAAESEGNFTHEQVLSSLR